MSLNDEVEKLKQAEYWLRCALPTSEHNQAALSHVIWVAQKSEDPELRERAAGILTGMGYSYFAKLPVAGELSRRQRHRGRHLASDLRRAGADCPGRPHPVSWSRGK